MVRHQRFGNHFTLSSGLRGVKPEVNQAWRDRNFLVLAGFPKT
jgi:hypothetical protein